MRAACLVAALLAVSSSAAPKKGTPKPPAVSPASAAAVEKAVRQYVKDQVEEEGSFTLEDEVLGREWDAKLLAVRAWEVRRAPEGRVSVCVDFKGEDPKRAQPLDVDFVLSEGDGEWVVDEVVIHKVGKTPRFAYDAEGARVPLKAKPARK